MKKLYFLILVLTTALSAQAQSTPQEIFKLYKEKICLVSFYQNTASDSKIGSFDKIKRYRIGVIVSPGGLIMVSSDVYPVSLDVVSTGNSPFSGIPTEFKVKLSDGKEYPAKFLGKDDQSEVAFIRLQNYATDVEIPWVKFVKTDNISIAEPIFVLELLSQNYGFKPLFTSYLISAIVETPKRKFLVNNTTTALSAGGLVLDQTGRAIGVTINQSVDFSFASPGDFENFHKDYLEIAPTEWFLDLINNPPNLQQNEVIQRSWLGIRMQGLKKDLKKYWKVPQEGGIIIDKVYPESPAEKAKLRKGDIILAVDDSILQVNDDEQTAELRNIIRNREPDSKIKFKLFRGGKVIHKTVILEAAPKSISLAEKYDVPQLGFEIRELTRDILYQSDLPLNTPGVFVFQVDRASPAGIGGLVIGDIVQEINNSPIRNLSQARQILEKAQQNLKSKYMLKLLNNQATRFVFLDLKK